MTPSLITALVLLVLLLFKHLVADFFLQTERMLSGRDTYVHFGRAQHAGVHAALSLPGFLLVGAPFVLTVILCLAEGVVHYHIDWAKGRHSASKGHGPEDANYWWAFGIDQFLHQLTYVAMVLIWASTTL